MHRAEKAGAEPKARITVWACTNVGLIFSSRFRHGWQDDQAMVEEF